MKTTMFKDDMLKAVIDLRKTQTRRVIKPQPFLQKHCNEYWFISSKAKTAVTIDQMKFLAPYKVGDIVGIRENFYIMKIRPTQYHAIGFEYNIDREYSHIILTDNEWAKYEKWKNQTGSKSKLFMFDSLIRYKIQITDIRVERVQDISFHDARAEGIERSSDASGYMWYTNYAFKSFPAQNAMFKSDPIKSFETLWDSINKKRGYGWDQKNYVFVYEFKVVK